MKNLLKFLVLACALVAIPFYLSSTFHRKDESLNSPGKTFFSAYVDLLYCEANLAEAGLDPALLSKALIGYYNLKAENKLSDKELLTIVDFRKPSSEERLFVLDLKSRKLLFHSLVAHGRNSGDLYATKFSNTESSLMSSLGFYVTTYPYTAKCGPALGLEGEEAGFNDNAAPRQVIIHGADYVSDGFAKKYGRIGRSWGCPALPLDKLVPVINTIANRTCLFIYSDDKNYQQHSRYLNEELAINEFMQERQLASL